MAKMTYDFPVKDVCGKIDRNSNVIFAHRGQTKYSFVQGKRTKPATEAEKAQRTKFGNVCKRVNQRLKDPSQMVQDQVAFAAQTTYKTLRQYVFALEWEKEN